MKNSFLILLLALGAAATAQAQVITSGNSAALGGSANDFWKGGTASGSPAAFDWETAANWSTGAVPTTANVAAFNAVTEAGAASVATLTQNEQPGEVSFNNGSYTISGTGTSTLLLSASGSSAFGNTAIAISGANQSTTLAGAYNDVINTPVNIYSYTNTSTGTVYGQQIALAGPSTAPDYAGTLTFNGLVTNESGTLEINGQSATSGLLTIAGGLANNSKIQFTGGTTTIQTTGSTAASGSTIALVAGASSGAGIMNLNVAAALAGSTFSNLSTFTTGSEMINIGANQAIVGSGVTPGVAAFNEAGGGLTNVTTFTMNGYNETFGVLTLTKGTLDFDLTGTGTDLAFADSSGVAWGPTTNAALNFTNVNLSTEIISFGNSASALTSAQLADITINGVGGVTLNSLGDLVPEPSAWSLMIVGVFGLVGVMVRTRRKSSV